MTHQSQMYWGRPATISLTDELAEVLLSDPSDAPERRLGGEYSALYETPNLPNRRRCSDVAG
ncbi:MAG: hypothetical protein ACFCVD_08950 [Nodosilinea sp.]